MTTLATTFQVHLNTVVHAYHTHTETDTPVENRYASSSAAGKKKDFSEEHPLCVVARVLIKNNILPSSNSSVWGVWRAVYETELKAQHFTNEELAQLQKYMSARDGYRTNSKIIAQIRQAREVTLAHDTQSEPSQMRRRPIDPQKRSGQQQNRQTQNRNDNRPAQRPSGGESTQSHGGGEEGQKERRREGVVVYVK
eukprot:GDKI01045225.1.p1 GENE.GDKI01045225.1~~GDKI01045225.1.p1  ORF type:complete len:196 (-),score=38.60 GDKI01045225.1:111-698(-)